MKKSAVPVVLSVQIVRLDISSDLRLPLVSVIEELLLVIQELLVSLGAELEVGPLHDGVHGTCLLAEAAVDALGHVDVVSGGPPGSVRPLLRLDSDGLGGTDGLAQLAGDTSLLSGGVPAGRKISVWW